MKHSSHLLEIALDDEEVKAYKETIPSNSNYEKKGQGHYILNNLRRGGRFGISLSNLVNDLKFDCKWVGLMVHLAFHVIFKGQNDFLYGLPR